MSKINFKVFYGKIDSFYENKIEYIKSDKFISDLMNNGIDLEDFVFIFKPFINSLDFVKRRFNKDKEEYKTELLRIKEIHEALMHVFNSLLNPTKPTLNKKVLRNIFISKDYYSIVSNVGKTTLNRYNIDNLYAIAFIPLEKRNAVKTIINDSSFDILSLSNTLKSFDKFVLNIKKDQRKIADNDKLKHVGFYDEKVFDRLKILLTEDTETDREIYMEKFMFNYYKDKYNN